MNKPFVQTRYHKFAFIILIWTLGHCMEANIEPVLEKSELFANPAKDAASVCVTIEPESELKRPWLKAVTVSRFFSSGIPNKSGTLYDLLEDAVSEMLRRKGYRMQCEKDSKKLEINIEQALIRWVPPQEFIQTPEPRYPGKVQIRFSAQYVYEGKSGAFRKEQTLSTMPQDELKTMEDQARLVLGELIADLYGQIPLEN